MNAPTPHLAITEDINPATGDSFYTASNSDLGQLPEIMQRASQAQRKWAALSFAERARYVLRMRDYIRDNADELAQIIAASNGKTLVDALATEVLPCTLACNWYAKKAAKVLAPDRRGPQTILFFNKFSEVQHLPIGIVGIISPWNYPLSIPFGEVVMGLMAGNAIILKVAAATPAVGGAIDRIIAAGKLPDDLFHQVTGSGGAVATAMFDNHIGKLFFTGSVGVGKQLMKQAAENLTPLSLELGGNDAMIVMDDANIERATNGAAWAAYQNAGQSCGGVERVYVHEKVYDKFVELLARKTNALRHGRGDNAFDVDIGSMTTQSQLNLVKRHLQDALDKGAKIAAQSKPVGDVSKGLFHPAMLLTNVSNDMLTMQDETFGPLLPVMKFNTLEEALQLSNNCNLALTASVWTRNTRKGRDIAARLEAGVVTVNDHLYTHGLSETPWGGWKLSGQGRTHGPEGLREMSRSRVVNWDIFPGQRNLWWYPFSKDTYQALKHALHLAIPRNIGDWLMSSLKLMPYMHKKMFNRWKV